MPVPRFNVSFPALHAGQQIVYDSPARFRVMVCGRRWRKSSLCLLTAIEQCMRGKLWWWVSPKFTTHGAVVWRMAKRLVHPLYPYGLKTNEVGHVMRFPGGGELYWRSTDDPDSLRSEGLDGVVLDEADFMPERAWTAALRPALTDKKGVALFATTPNREGGWLHRLFQRAQRGDDPEWAAWQFPSWSNPHLDPAEFESARKDMPEITFRREYGAEFVSAEGARVRRENIKRGTPPKGLQIAVGVDLAISQKQTADFTACVAVGREKSGKIWILGAERRRATFHEQMQMIDSFAKLHGASIVGVEQVAYQAAAVQELLRTTMLPVRGIKVDRDKVSRFAPLEARYEQGLVWHADTLPAAFDDEVLSFPVGQFDDQVDAAVHAYSLLAATPLGEVYRPKARRRGRAPRFRI